MPPHKEIDKVIIEFGNGNEELKSLDCFIKQCLAQSKANLCIKRLISFLDCKVDSGLWFIGKHNVR